MFREVDDIAGLSATDHRVGVCFDQVGYQDGYPIFVGEFELFEIGV